MRLSIIDNLFVIANTRLCYIFYMVPINLQYYPSFLEEEVREGHLVSSEMKKLWLVELDILNKFVQVCDKYDITYFADAGTLLGAVRHGGYVPWDDDIDVILLRKDYDRFMEVAKTEFQYPYYVYNVHDDYSKQLTTRIKRLDTALMGMNDATEALNGNKKVFKIIKCIQIDVFCADNCPNTPVERKRLQNKINFCALNVYRAYNQFNIVYKKTNLTEDVYNNFKNRLRCCVNNLEDTCKSYENIETSYIYNNSFVHNDMESFKLRYKEDYSDYILMPFEMLTLKCPVGYDRALDMMYTNRSCISWKIPLKNYAFHKQDKLKYIDVDHPYTDYMRYYYNKPEDLKRITPSNE